MRHQDRLTNRAAQSFFLNSIFKKKILFFLSYCLLPLEDSDLGECLLKLESVRTLLSIMTDNN